MCCKKRNPIKKFPYYGRKNTSSYEQRKCIDCKNKEWERLNKNLDLERFLKIVLCNTMRRSKNKLFEGNNIDIDFLRELYHKQEGKCAVSGIELTYKRHLGTKVLTNISLDRIDSKKPYTKDNVQFVCVGINLMKNNIDNEEFLNFFNEIKKASI